MHVASGARGPRSTVAQVITAGVFCSVAGFCDGEVRNGNALVSLFS